MLLLYIKSVYIVICSKKKQDRIQETRHNFKINGVERIVAVYSRCMNNKVRIVKKPSITRYLTFYVYRTFPGEYIE